MLALALTLTSAHAADPLRIRIEDPAVREVHLDCAGKKLRAPVRDGWATFQESIDRCSVALLSTSGELDGPGEYLCGVGGCARGDVQHRRVEAAPDRVTVVITDDSASMLELRCPSGYRERANVETNTAVFDKVPDENCELFWKGTNALAKAIKLRPGLWYCQENSGTGICAKR